jgi:O-antigen chain-terminating methyltransferase
LSNGAAFAFDGLALSADASTFVELAYAAVLRRAPDPEAKQVAVAAIDGGGVPRHEFIRSLVASREFEEMALIEEVYGKASGGPVDLESPVGPGLSERVVEVPWVLSRYRGEQAVLDIGYAHAPAAYLSLLLSLAIPDLHGVDLVTREIQGFTGLAADIRRLPYEDRLFDLVLCVSTLEHIGRDNTRYGAPGAEDARGDKAALLEIARVLRPGGRLLVTVPFGQPQDHGWFVQYGERDWSRLLESVPLEVTEAAGYRLLADGWVRVADLSELSGCRYGEPGPGAMSILCSELTRV